MLALLHDAVIAGVGFTVGCFCPAVARKVKSWFSKEGTAIKPSLVAGIGKIESAAKTEAKKL